MTTQYAPLTAYRITYNDGEVRETNMAADVTLEEARAYFLGHTFVYWEDEETGKEYKHTCVGVELLTA